MYDDYIMKKVRAMIAIDENDTSMDSEIESMSRTEILDLVLAYEGIINYAGAEAVKDWIADIYGIEFED